MGVGRGYCGAGPCGEGRPLRHHDTMASPIRYGYWTKGQPGRGQHRQQKKAPPVEGGARRDVGVDLSWARNL